MLGDEIGVPRSHYFSLCGNPSLLTFLEVPSSLGKAVGCLSTLGYSDSKGSGAFFASRILTKVHALL